MLVNVKVYRTTPPGVVVVTLVDAEIASCATPTLVEHRGSPVPPVWGQLVPSEAEVSVLDRAVLLVTALLTATVKVMVTDPAAGTSPDQVRSGLVNSTVPPAPLIGGGG